MSTTTQNGTRAFDESLFPPGFLASVESRSRGERERACARLERAQQEGRARWLVFTRQFPDDFAESVEPYRNDAWRHRARRAWWAEFDAKTLGILTTGAITFLTVDSPMYATVAALASMVGFFALTALLELWLSKLEWNRFLRWFGSIYTPLLVIAMVGGAVLAADRLATGDLALSLASTEGLMIAMVELALLVSGAIAAAARVVFETPELLTNEFEANADRLRELSREENPIIKTQEVAS